LASTFEKVSIAAQHGFLKKLRFRRFAPAIRKLETVPGSGMLSMPIFATLID
jgi:hypothetical protein